VRSSSLVAAALLALASPASAALVTHDFVATVTSSDGTVLQTGDMVSGRFVVSDDPAFCGLTGYELALITFCDTGPFAPPGQPWSVSLAAAGQATTIANPQVDFEMRITLGRYDDPSDPSQGHGSDGFLVRTTTGSGSFVLELVDLTGDAYSQPEGAIPVFPVASDFENLAAWNLRKIVTSSGLGFGTFTAELTSLVAVPEPDAVALLAVGALLLARLRSAQAA
jgi:hypothetical protein